MDTDGFNAGMEFENMLEAELRGRLFSRNVSDLKLIIDSDDSKTKISNFVEKCKPYVRVQSVCKVIGRFIQPQFSLKSENFKFGDFDIAVQNTTHIVELKCSKEVEQGGVYRFGPNVGKPIPEWYEITVRCHPYGNRFCCTC
jgi:hypothetical protein